jgi:hypothetical protein
MREGVRLDRGPTALVVIALLRSEGAVVTTTETVLFQLLGRADSEDFRALAPLLK